MAGPIPVSEMELMQQIVLKSPGEFESRTASATERKPQEALIRVARVGVCGSDFHAFHGRHPIYTYPRILGHEVSGVITEVPDNARGLKVGDRCAVDPYLSCGVCTMCKAGRTNCCEKLKLYGIHLDGGMQEYISVPTHLLYPSTKLSLDELALIETLGIGAHAVARSGVHAGDTVLVVGAGPIGMSAAVFAHLEGAQVRVIEKKAWRRTLVDKLGIAAFEEAEGQLADVVFDATGSAEVMAQSLHNVALGGRLVYVGLTSAPIQLDDAMFHRKEVTLIASRNSANQFARIIRLLEEGKIDTASWITDRMSLDQVPVQFAELPMRDHLMKAIVDVSNAEPAMPGRP